MTTDQVREFALAFNDDVRSRAQDGVEFSTEVECFADAVLERFEEAGLVEEPEVCIRGGRLGRSNWEISGWAFPPSEDEDLSQLSILALHFNDSPELLPVSAEELRKKFELAVNFVDGMLEGKASSLEPAADAAALGRIIHQRRKHLRKIVVLLATDGVTQRLKEIASELRGDIEISCAIWDIERISRLADPKQQEIEIDVPDMLDGRGLPCLKVPEEDPHYDAYLCVVPGTLLYKAYEEYGQRLLELNVRAFLSVAGKVNKGIRDTIRTSPDRFFPYNNGLAMTARSVEVRRSPEGHDEIVRIVGLQIVNGGQTTASIHRAWKIDRAEESVGKVFVQGKLTVITTADDDHDGFIDLVRSISKFANKQNAVKDDDLEANQPWHVSFEKLSRQVWTPGAKSMWYYERSRGSFATEKLRSATTPARRREFDLRWPRTQLITKTDLAKAINAWNQRPEIVSLGGQKNFKYFMSFLDSQVNRPTLDEGEYKRTVGKVIFFRDVTKVVNGLKEEIPAYRANVIAYLIAYLSYRMPTGMDFDKVWEKQSIPDSVKKALAQWAAPIYNRIISSADGRNPSEWCKKEECWEKVRELDLHTSLNLPRYASPTVPLSYSAADVDTAAAKAISEVRRLTPDEWKHLSQWALEQEDLHYKAPSIIATLHAAAKRGWPKPPSPKQAAAVMRTIELWRAAAGEGAAASG
jgi:hypothetical protein